MHARAALAALALLAPGAAGQVSTIDADEEVVFYRTYGCPAEDGQAWDLRVHGWVFERERRGEYLAELLVRLGIEAAEINDANRPQLARRLAAFLVDNERGQRIIIRIGGLSFPLDPTGPDGHCFGRVRLTAEQLAGVRVAGATPAGSVPFEAVLRAGDGRRFAGAVELIESAGVSVISDIDDTIKISGVADRSTLLRNTFLRPYVPVPGMAAAYRSWAERSGASFHYVSASPWQLYEPLAEFLDSAGFPAGPLELKPFRWKDERFFDLLAAPETYKRPVIEELLAALPGRSFVLVGDSGEQDPEIYAALARQHPGRIVKILIRDLESGDGNAARFRRVFDGLPDSLWQVFRSADALPAELPRPAASAPGRP